MTQSVRESIYQAISSIRLIDPHTHINPHNAASSTLADILGYHYYTELIHSAGMPREEIEEDGLHPRELVERLVHGLPNIENTANYQWLISICRTFFGFEDDRIDHSNWESLYDAAEAKMSSAEWPQMVLDQSNVEAVFLTNDFDDDLEGFDTDTYIPCLRTDDLVFHLAKPETRQRLAVCTGMELDGSLRNLRDSLEQRFRHFVSSGARACAISIPPTFQPQPVSDGRATTALDEVLRHGTAADPSHQAALSRRVFWTLAELCDQYQLPFDLMIGVNRGVYQDGVYQGTDLYDSRVSLIQYQELFNTFPEVRFPISVLASVTNQELVSYSWIFPNVISNGHWWYSNTPSFISRDAAARLEAIPRTKQIGYYSDAYKLEFVWPKFDMYRQILAGILADHFVGFCGWSEERAIELGRQVLRDNVDEIFPTPQDPAATTSMEETYVDDSVQIDNEDAVAEPPPTSAALAAGAIGIVEVQDQQQLDETVGIGDTLEETGEFHPDHAQQPPEQAGLEQAGREQAEDLRETVEEVEHALSDDDGIELGAEQDEDDVQLDYMEEASQETADDPYAASNRLETGQQHESADEFDTVDQEMLPELPTVAELQDTVRIDEGAGIHVPADAEPAAAASDVDPTAETLELDTLPTEDEIQAVDVPDVELTEDDSQAPDAAAIDAEADASPLLVGDIVHEDDDGDVDVLEETLDEPVAGEQIRMLRGEDSFTPDEDSMQLTRDPMTGELTFQMPETSAEPPAAAELADTDELEMPETAEELQMAEETPQPAATPFIDPADSAEIDYVEEVDGDAEIDSVQQSADNPPPNNDADAGIDLEDTIEFDDESNERQ